MVLMMSMVMAMVLVVAQQYLELCSLELLPDITIACLVLLQLGLYQSQQPLLAGQLCLRLLQLLMKLTNPGG